MKNKFLYFAVLAAMGLASCEPEFENEISDASYSKGDADFTSYVALGNSLSAGYIDGTVSKGSQQYSFPNMLSQQFAIVGGGEFTQPDFSMDANNIGGLLLGGNPILDPMSGANLFPTRMVFDESELRPENLNATSTNEVSALQAKAYHNMGVPGMKSFHATFSGYGSLTGLGTGTANPWYVRHATSASATVLGDAMQMNPTFFTNWIGDMDVLAYATSGGVGSTAGTGANDITPMSVFVPSYDGVLNTLTANGTNNVKGVLCTIPYVTSIPYFTRIPYAPVQAEVINANPQAPLLVALYQFLAVATNGRIMPLNTAAGAMNPVIIVDEDLTDLSAQISAYAAGSGNPLLVSNAATLGAVYGRARQTTANDLIVLPASGVIGQTNANPAPFNINGLTAPLADRWVLTQIEVGHVTTATNAINTHIRSKESANIAIADMNLFMQQLASPTGLTVEDGTVYNAQYFNGTNIGSVLFSLDGVHPNARGYAVIANKIIGVINEHFNAKLPYKNSASYPGVHLVTSN
ncbi:G-D-S-L family lipolytic protein [Flavobacterium sp.]|uniref:G-D-S-L family lipolytic protein n=1 Tax=Flavobacterium sp. TaxID=239 RepID=UPI0028BECA83|nr:G-D-S-L family lipolytic protein [Flavobacterium sp.]